VAVMIGYSGTGYKGMQIDNKQKTIEGDLFNAFVAAGAISKANADDPKKSSLVRCARTDKGVHAAGNVISLKLIIEEDDIIEKINANLSEQIRVWGIQRTIGSFSCYQACDSRWYEYLIPTHAFLPPHWRSMRKKKVTWKSTVRGRPK
jgi:tRNA pseudouridine38-40 synthase